MAKTTEEQQINRFFSHDEDASIDPKMLKLLEYFDIHQDDFTPETLKSLLPLAAIGAFWRIVEYMHIQKLPVDSVKTLAYHFGKIPPEFLQLILDNFGLFHKEIDESGIEIYVSDRILRNKKFVQDKSGKQKEAADFRWLLSAFNKEYDLVFGEKPTLTKEEIKTLKTYFENVDNLKELLPDIFYTLSTLKFDNNYKPRVNWLLKENNLARILNGEFGKLKHKKNEEEIKAEQQFESQENEILKQEDDNLYNSIFDKDTALDYIRFSKFINRKDLQHDATFAMLAKKYSLSLKEGKAAAKKAVQDV